MLRKIHRNIARNKMKKEGLTGVNKKKFGEKRSFFAWNWRDYAGL